MNKIYENVFNPKTTRKKITILHYFFKEKSPNSNNKLKKINLIIFVVKIKQEVYHFLYKNYNCNEKQFRNFALWD